jgi:hypothetical protein
MAQTTKKERQLLDFDQEAYDYALKGLEEFRKGAEFLRDCFQLQELLSPELHEFSTEDYQGILQSGNQFIADKVHEAVMASFDRLGPGMRSQYKNHKVYIDTSYGTEKLERVIESVESSPPGRRSAHINPGMIEFSKGEAVISKTAIKSLREEFSIYDDDPLAREVFELLTVGEATLNAIQTIIERRSREAEQQSGMKLARNIQIFKPKGVQDGPEPKREQRGLFWLDGKKQWHLNIKPFK